MLHVTSWSCPLLQYRFAQLICDAPNLSMWIFMSGLSVYSMIYSFPVLLVAPSVLIQCLPDFRETYRFLSAQSTV